MTDSSTVLAALPEHRREAVVRWLSSEIGACAECSEPVLITQPHRAGKDGFEHITCNQAVTVEEPEPEEISPAVEARARRSDWG
ncbi:hypothetical protein NBH00_06635 [Paraconexibacter antarcticus]|uniref:Uncharacterized protein n=1 Tax=Paraconexibacter antarcticus TaxID=2949664 RepID=A0ABY5DWH4_9ACTN|nr:hypothetical protein [Paraconexibacter antarcticus]UTI65884.1 hypothetical protein NBH00_06635 [Paraconexibacter antarcticus]